MESKNQNKKLGELGEKIAAEFLLKKGYELLQKNYTSNKLEVDLIMKDSKQNQLVFVEVKTRNNPIVDPEIAVGKTKQRNLLRAAENYLSENNLKTELRFDIISIAIKDGKTEIEHFEDAFYPFNSF